MAGPMSHDTVMRVDGLLDGIRLLVKDETRNVSGSHKERAALAVARRAAAEGHRRVAVGSCGNYGLAVAVACRAVGIAATVVLPRGWSGLARTVRRLGARVMLIDGCYEDAVAASRQVAADEGTADGNVDGPYATTVQRALGQIAYELREVLAEPPRTLWVPLGNGTTVTAIGCAVIEMGWPTKVVGVTSTGNNSILASWPAVVHTPIPPEALAPTRECAPLVNWCALHGDAALRVLHATGGFVVGVDDEQLLQARAGLACYRVAASPAGAAGVAGASALLATTSVTTHVAILTGR